MSTPITIHLPLIQRAADDQPSLAQRLKTRALNLLHAYLEVAERENRIAMEAKIQRD